METHWHITNVLQNFLRKFQLNVILDIRAVVTIGHMPHPEFEQSRYSQNMNWLKTENYIVVGCDFDTFGQHQHPKFESIFTHNQTNTKLILISTKNTTIPIIIQA